MNPKISIIVPAYNSSKTIEKCLKSIISQSFEDFEILVVNDGSTDNTISIIEKSFSDKRIKVINKSNGGLASARNMGIQNSLGKYFCTIDSDDTIHQDYLKILFETITNNEADICLCESKYIYSGITQEIHINKHLKNISTIKKEDLENNFFWITQKYQMSDSWNKIYKSSFVKQSGIIFDLPRQYNGTDLLFNHLLLLAQPKITLVRDVLYFHNMEVIGSNTSRKDKNLFKGFLYITEKIYDKAKQLNLNNAFKKQLYLLLLKFLRNSLIDEYMTKNISNYKIKQLENIKLYFKYRKMYLELNFISIKNINLMIFQVIVNFKLYILIRLYISLKCKTINRFRNKEEKS